MKYNDTCIVCHDGKIVRGIYGRVVSSTQYKFTVAFCYHGKPEVITFRKSKLTHKRFTYGVNSGAFVVIPMNQMKAWYSSYAEAVQANTVEHMNPEVWL